MAINSTNWSSSTPTSSNWSQPTTTIGTTTAYDTATAYDSSSIYDGVATIPTIEYNSTNWGKSTTNNTNWAVACFIALIFGSLVFAGGVL